MKATKVRFRKNAIGRNLTLKNIAAFSQALGLPASKLLAKAEALIDKR